MDCANWYVVFTENTVISDTFYPSLRLHLFHFAVSLAKQKSFHNFKRIFFLIFANVFCLSNNIQLCYTFLFGEANQTMNIFIALH